MLIILKHNDKILRAENTKWAKELIDIIMNPEDDSWNHCPFSPWELINCQNKQKNTALHLAVENQSTQVAHCLIENGANIVMRLFLSAFTT